MLTTAPHLRTLRPSPTTAEFTVSTQLIHLNPQRTILNIVLWTIRLATLLSCFLLLHAKYEELSPPPPLPPPPSPPPYSSLHASSSLHQHHTHFHNHNHNQYQYQHHQHPPAPPPLRPAVPQVLQVLLAAAAAAAASSSPAGQFFARLALPTPACVLLPACLGASYLALLRFHQAEKLLVLRGLGIQTWSAGRTVVGGGSNTRFIPTAKVRDVLVNEAFLGNEIRFYLIVVVEGEDDVVVVFPGILPHRDIVLEVWNGVRGCLWEGGKNPRWAGKFTG
ncbi:hypothetical protein MKZ38_006228 [Zalerion maritima]|uniref:Phosphatidylinositol N-acetylglucosaminyltransferase subunit H conserved domain-containing protein n=1 Tax=Zalerion maritima TaxID=339359 RepID=A0AAD5WUJ7_9PEZI|nr:hypothetical protein MKZ38_006228 [Zalerion maritima]